MFTAVDTYLLPTNVPTFLPSCLKMWANIFLKNGPIPASYSFIFGLFKQTIQF